MSPLTASDGHLPDQLPPRRILIVEDDPVMPLGLEQFFEDYPQYQVTDCNLAI